jgi:hypothetical protein
MLTLKAFGAPDLRDSEGTPRGSVLAQTKRAALLAYLLLALQQALGAEDWVGALRLYRGDLLEVVHVKGAPAVVDWVDRERVRLREEAAGAAWRLAHQPIGAGKLVEAERTA